MQKVKNEIFTIYDIKDAYRKLKTHFYYDNSNHIVRRQIADFETAFETTKELNDYFQQLADDLNNKNKNLLIEKYSNKINYYLQPKGFENDILEEDCESLIVTNRYISDQYQLKSFNYFIKIPIELHIVNVLWIIKLGYLLDSQYCYYSDKKNSYCYANRLEIDENTDKILNGNKLFKTYARQYQKWRDDCIQTAEDLLENHKKDVIIVSLDIKRYYPSANIDYSLINNDLKIRCENKSLDADYEKYHFLTTILGEIRDIYFEKIKTIWEEEKRLTNKESEQLASDKPIPIGMLSSNVIANWYLRNFDEKVNKYVKPAFYGRYVDDILIVIENRGGCSELEKEKGKCDKNCCEHIRKLTIDKILSQYFCGCNTTNCLHPVLTKKEMQNDSEEITKDNHNEKNTHCDYFININNSELRIQGKKVKLFVFDANSTKAMLQKFKDTIRKHSSEFRFLPEEDRIQEDFVQETYSIDYNDTINKLRSIDKYQLDRFKISSYLAKQLMLAKYSTNNVHFNKTKEELLYAFSGRMGLELYLFWDKVLTYFVLNNNDEIFCEFVRKITINIERIRYRNDNVLNLIKKELVSYLKESIYLALSLNPNFIYKNNNENNKFELKNTFENLSKNKNFENIFNKIDYNYQINQLLDSAMIKHKYCYMPILNYTEIKSQKEFINFTDENILLRKDIPNLLSEENNKIEFNPKRFSFEEIMLYENFKNINNTQSPELIIENTINNYILLNLKQFGTTNKEEKLKKYFKSISVQTDNFKCIPIIKLNIKKGNYPPNLSQLKIGLFNTKVSDDSIYKNLKSHQELSFDELQEYIRFLNLAIQNNKIKCDMIVFPEVCIPYQALGLLSDFSKKHKVAIICGLKHIVIDNKALNYIATILPFDIGHYTDSYINLRLKQCYSPGEIKEIKMLGKNVPIVEEELINNLFCWNNLYFAVYDCFELADVNYRSKFKSYVDIIIACEWNKDVEYFNNIIKSAARDLHCYVVQVNTSQFGDSKIIAPKKSSEMTLLNIKGGENNILIGSIDINQLREFQLKETEYLEDVDKIFKPLPPLFKKDTERLKNAEP